MSDNKAIVRNYVEQVWTKRNLAAIDDYITSDYVQHARGVSHGREGVKAFFAMLNQAFSDLTYHVEDMVAEATKCAGAGTWAANILEHFKGCRPQANLSL